MLYSQIVLTRGLPFELRLPEQKPLALGSLTKEQFDAQMQLGMDDMAAGRVVPAAAVEDEMRRLYRK